jgi:phage shock protein A
MKTRMGVLVERMGALEIEARSALKREEEIVQLIRKDASQYLNVRDELKTLTQRLTDIRTEKDRLDHELQALQTPTH